MQLGRGMAIVGVGVALAAAAAAPARATYGARTTADEPQYLLTAISLAEDFDLDISDELRQERWRPFHEALLPQQTEVQHDGRELSPHDPLLPLLLAGAVALGGWLGAKLALALMAGALAALLLWVAVRRFGVAVGPASWVVGAFGSTAPLVVYGAQVYPELPAALAVTVAIAALTGPRPQAALASAAVVALPWLSVKYAPVAVVLAALLLARLPSRRTVLGVFAVAALAYVAFHQAVYGGWTVYAAGDHFTGGELTVAGERPDFLGRSYRLVGLLFDRTYGLVAWAPAFALAVVAVGALARRRPPGWTVLAFPLLAGWLTATFVAFTMHGVWWPGRQVVVVLPAGVLAVAWWVGQASVRWRAAFAALSVAGVAIWAWALADVLTLGRRLAVEVDRDAGPLQAAVRVLLPDYRHPSAATWAVHGLWIAAAGVLVLAGWLSIDSRRLHDQDHRPPAAGRSRPDRTGDRVRIG